jgi:hypothetical protein
VTHSSATHINISIISTILQSHSKMCQCGRNHYSSECQKPKQDRLHVKTVANNIHTTSQDVKQEQIAYEGSQLASGIQIYTNITPFAWQKASFSWHNHRKLNPTTSHPTKTDQSRQHLQQTNHRYNRNSLSEVVIEIISYSRVAASESFNIS